MHVVLHASVADEECLECALTLDFHNFSVGLYMCVHVREGRNFLYPLPLPLQMTLRN